MSTFLGKIEEIPGISVDRFDFRNLNSEAYFLSHCHVDHMVGLDTAAFQGTLRENKRFIYVSHVSKEILKRLYPNIEKYTKELDFYSPTSIQLKVGVISVIPIPSGHCPGSVMFLFESDKTILYTGDYRISPKDLKNIKAFYDSHGLLQNIYKIYLDTTFFSKSYLQFPSRQESISEICTLIKDWLDISENHVININTSARYGYEYVFMEIYRKINMPVHVNEDAYAFYSMIPEMDKTVTLDGSKTRIHSACGATYRSLCLAHTSEYKMRSIKMSAMRWKTKHLEEGITSETPYGAFFVCYSTHASYEEGEELIRFLKPKAIEPCVLGDDDELNNEIYESIDALIESENESPSKRPKLFNISKLQETTEIVNKEEYAPAPDGDDYFESALESPPRTDLEIE